MSETVAGRLARLGLALPVPPPAIGPVEPFVRHDDVVYTSGQLPIREGRLIAVGRLGAELDVAAGQDAARTCAINVLAQLQAAGGSLDAVARLIKITVFVACTDDFDQQPQVGDGASAVFLDVLGPAGAHARWASPHWPAAHRWSSRRSRSSSPPIPLEDHAGTHLLIRGLTSSRLELLASDS